MDTLIERYNLEHICFADEDFFCDLKRIKALVPELQKRKITWDANCRADYIREGHIDDGMLKMLYESGLRELRFGLESGSPRILKLLNKQITVEQSLEAIKKITRYHIDASLSFMMGIPGEDAQDILKTLALILKLHKINPKNIFIGPNAFRPYPGSILFNRCVENGLTVPSLLNEWSTFCMPDYPIYQRNIFPWLLEADLCRRANLWRAYLGKGYLPRWLLYPILQFHIVTQCRFIDLDYSVLKFFKKIYRHTRGSR
jgi:radical SAM superfamily enzyme YgiQ (UPF0313 family)